MLDLLHFALRAGGFLFLGAAETIGKLTDRFAPGRRGAARVPAARRLSRRGAPAGAAHG